MVIRRIFEAYILPGASLRSVADMLNRDGIKTGTGKTWSQTTVRHVLQNRKYCGSFVRFKFTVGKFHAISDGEIVARTKTDKHTEAEPLVVEANHEPIITTELFEAAQRKLALNKKRTVRRDAHQYVFSGLIRCGDCNCTMRGQPARHQNANGEKTRYVYHCSTFHTRGKSACYSNGIREAVLLNCVHRKLDERYFGDAAIERMRGRIKQAQAQAAEPVSPVDQRQLRKRIEILDRQIDTGAGRIFTAPEALVPKLYAKLETLRQERDQLQRQLDSVGRTETRSAAEQDQEVEAALDALRRLRETFDVAGPEDLRELVSGLVVRIELEFTHKQDGKLTRNTCTGGEILVRPDAGLGSLLLQTSATPASRPWRPAGRNLRHRPAYTQLSLSLTSTTPANRRLAYLPLAWTSGSEQSVPPPPYLASRSARLRIVSCGSTFASYAAVSNGTTTLSGFRRGWPRRTMPPRPRTASCWSHPGPGCP